LFAESTPESVANHADSGASPGHIRLRAAFETCLNRTAAGRAAAKIARNGKRFDSCRNISREKIKWAAIQRPAAVEFALAG
jgi:hypothetical protein